jgi:hypothetical protein
MVGIDMEVISNTTFGKPIDQFYMPIHLLEFRTLQLLLMLIRLLLSSQLKLQKHYSKLQVELLEMKLCII